MVNEEKRGDNKYFRCEVCDFYYKNKTLAKKCEDFCKENKSCNLDIVQYAINFTIGK